MQITVLTPFKGVSYFQALALQKLGQVQGVEFSFVYHAIFPKADCRTASKNSLYKWWRDRLGHSPLERKVRVTEVLPKSHPLPLEMEYRDRYSAHLTAEGSSTLSLLEPDVLLNLDTHILRGDILNIPKYGVWSFHHGNPRKFRGAPPGFWEIYQGVAESGAILQRLGERLDDGVVLREATLPTVFHSYQEQRDALFGVSVNWPAEVATEILEGKPLPQCTKAPSSAPITRMPSAWQVLTFWAKLLKGQVRHQVGAGSSF